MSQNNWIAESIVDLVRERAEAQCNNCMAYFEAWEIQEAEHELLAIALGFFGDKGHNASLSELYILEETYIGRVEPQSNKRKKLKGTHNILSSSTDS